MAQISRDHLGSLLCCGVAAALLWHVFQNVGMTMGIMPITGIPLPFISYGGSSTVAFFAMIGLVQNVYLRGTEHTAHERRTRARARMGRS